MKKKETRPVKCQKTPASAPPRPRTWKLPGGEASLLLLVFALALTLRLIYLFEISRAPYFDQPIGDSIIYYHRALEILAGDWLGHEIYFHSSPPYPYFMAIFLGLSGHSFFALGLAQILIGSGNCLLIYLLAKKLAGGEIIPGLLAGLFAAGYGLFAFFDADLLMIFLTLFFTDLALLLLLETKNPGATSRSPLPSAQPPPIWKRESALALLAGLSLGLAALDKTNLLLFAPVGAWWLAGEFSLAWKSWRWQPALLFAAGTALMILPVTLRNYVVDRDLVLVSSNAGVNLFIGNNPEGRGIFFLPFDSGLRNTDLYGSSVQAAEKETGRRLKPSEVSSFWAAKAINFAREEPGAAAALLGRKLWLLWNSYEIPNHVNFYFVRSEYAPVLKFMFAGFWLVAPLALVGLGLRLRRGLSSTDKLILGFLLSFMLSLLPFFITERYRLPMVPVLIALAAAALVELARAFQRRAWKTLLGAGVGLAAAAVVVNGPQIHYDYSFIRVVIAAKYIERALQAPQAGIADLKKAVVELKWALETDPTSTDAHYNLGSAYAMVGYYSGAIREWEEALRIDPGVSEAAVALRDAKRKFAQTGDLARVEAIPLSPYEEAKAAMARGQVDLAVALLQEVVRKDPFHFQACNDLGTLYYHRGQYDLAVKVLRQGLKYRPDHFILMNNLAGVYYQSGNQNQAKKLWQACLRQQPKSELILNQLKMVRE